MIVYLPTGKWLFFNGFRVGKYTIIPWIVWVWHIGKSFDSSRPLVGGYVIVSLASLDVGSKPQRRHSCRVSLHYGEHSPERPVTMQQPMKEHPKICCFHVHSINVMNEMYVNYKYFLFSCPFYQSHEMLLVFPNYRYFCQESRNVRNNMSSDTLRTPIA